MLKRMGTDKEYRKDSPMSAVWWLIWMLCVAMWTAAGCASRRDVVLSRLLEDMHASNSAGQGSGPDAPDVPGTGLPPLAPEAAPVTKTTRQDTEITIQPDSLVQVSVQEDPSLDGSYPVNAIGAIEMGYIGPIILHHKTESEAARKVEEILKSRQFRNATVQVRILRASYDKVRVAGAVGTPGVIQIGAGDSISLNNALLRAGEIRASASGTHVRIVRGGMLSAVSKSLQGEEYSLVSEDGKPEVPDILLHNNDVAYVYSVSPGGSTAGAGEKEILVLGEVRRPGLYRFASGESCSIMHLIFKMGGLPPYAKTKAIRILRRDQDGREDELVVNADAILSEGNPDNDVPLENGDRVIVPARRLTLF